MKPRSVRSGKGVNEPKVTRLRIGVKKPKCKRSGTSTDKPGQALLQSDGERSEVASDLTDRDKSNCKESRTRMAKSSRPPPNIKNVEAS